VHFFARHGVPQRPEYRFELNTGDAIERPPFCCVSGWNFAEKGRNLSLRSIAGGGRCSNKGRPDLEQTLKLPFCQLEDLAQWDPLKDLIMNTIVGHDFSPFPMPGTSC
jgi:hypothetical protein